MIKKIVISAVLLLLLIGLTSGYQNETSTNDLFSKNSTPDIPKENDSVLTNVSNQPTDKNVLNYKIQKLNVVKSNSTLNAQNDKHKKGDFNRILLKQGAIYTNESKNSLQNVPTQYYPNNVNKYYLIQLSGIIKDKWLQFLENENVELLNYIPENSYLVKMNSTTKNRLDSEDFIQYIGIYKPEYKISPSINESKSNLILNVIAFEGTNLNNTLDELNSTNSTIVMYNDNYIRINLKNTNITNIAKINSVSWIEEYKRPTICNDVARSIMNVDLYETSLSGTGQIIAIADTGIDTGFSYDSMHPDIRNSLVGIKAYEDARDFSGHGTHVAGSAVGDGSASDGRYKGTAPNANLYFQALSPIDSEYLNPPSPLNDLFKDAYENGARIHSNSWGHNGDYDSSSRSVDEFMWNHKDMLILFAAGNAGPAKNTIGSPGNAKNCLTVGASESANPSTIADFSSRGPTEDGRIKPDIVAPGTSITSTRSSYAGGWGYYTDMQGTSMATPLTAGTAALVRQFYMEYRGTTPTASLIKATLINGASDLGYLSYSQGWGRVDLYNSISDVRWDQNILVDTDEKIETKFYVDDNSKPLKVTICWTDYPGYFSASDSYVNDINLEVISPSGDIYGSYSVANNVEHVEIQNPEIGRYVVKMRGYNVPEGPQPISLVISGSTKTIDVSYLDVFPQNPVLYEDETVSFSADVYDQDGNQVNLPVTWANTNNTVGLIDQKGLFTATNAGETTVLAECDDYSIGTDVTVKEIITDSNPESNRIIGKKNVTQTFTINTSLNCDVTWKLNGTNIRSDNNVLSSSYTNQTPKIGTYEVTAFVSSPRGTDQVSWLWEVKPGNYYKGYRVWDADKELSLNYTWDGYSHNEFFYDINTDSNSESMTISLDDKTDRDIDVGDFTYSAKQIETNFEYEYWRSYKAIGFMGSKYFAGYSKNTSDLIAYNDVNLMDKGIISKILMDTNDCDSLATNSPLELADGYALNILKFDSTEDKLWVSLTKDGVEVDNETLNLDDVYETYVYEKKLAEFDNFPIIAVGLGNGRGSASDAEGNVNYFFSVDGIFQISDEYTKLDVGDSYGKTQVDTLNANEISMINKEPIVLTGGELVNVTDNVKFMVADDDTLRFAPYSRNDFSYNYSLPGTITDNGQFEWSALNFEGFYYDLDDGLLSEYLKVYTTDRNINAGELIYSSQSIQRNFKYDSWGKYESIGFMGENYLSGYNANSKIIDKDVDLLSNNEIAKILINKDSGTSVGSGSALFLEEGYAVVPRQVDKDGNKVWFELYKDGKYLDDQIVSLNDEGNFVYKPKIGHYPEIPLIAFHVDNIKENNEILVDGIFQISDNFANIKHGDIFGKMTVSKINSDQIRMENINQINLERGRNIEIMDNFTFNTADSNELRYYPSKNVFTSPKLITGYHPVENPVSYVGDYQQFSVELNESCDTTWKLDGKIQQTSSSTYEVSSNEFGIHKVTAIVSNSNHTKIHEWLWEVTYDDSKSPDLMLKSNPENRISKNNPASITVRSIDEHPYINEFIIKDDKGTTVLERNLTDNVNDGQEYTFNWDSTDDAGEIVKSGKYYLILNSTDMVGNNAKENVSIIVDNEKPIANISDINGNFHDGKSVYTNSNLSINGTASGTPGNISDITVLLDSESTNYKQILQSDYMAGNWSCSENLSSIPDDGKYRIRITTQDPAGNYNTTISDAFVIIDREPPEMSHKIKTINNSHARINVTSSELLSKSPSVILNDEEIPVSKNNGNWSGIFRLNYENYNISIVGTDLAGNTIVENSSAFVTNIITSGNTANMVNNQTGTSIVFNTTAETSGSLLMQEMDSPSVELNNRLVGIHFIDVQLEEKLSDNLKNATIAIRINETKLPKGIDENDISIRYYNASNDTWDKIHTDIKTIEGSRYWTAEVKHFSIYGAVAVDDIKPQLESVYPADGSQLKYGTSDVAMKFVYEDAQSGINTSNITIEFNGTNVTESSNTTITGSWTTYNITNLTSKEYNCSLVVFDKAGNQNDFTTNFEIAEKSDENKKSSSSSSSGGGGSTGEDVENIASKAAQLQTVTAGSQVSYEFGTDESSISFIKFKGTTNSGQIKALIENLKNTSTLVNEKAPGRVYKNINIWVGNSAFDSNDMEDPLIGFRVSKDWVSRNNVSTDSITLLHYSNGWEHGKPTSGSIASITRNAVDNKEWRSLETVQIDEDDKYFYFQAETVSFSPFAISSLDADNKPEAEMDEISKSADGITNSKSKEFSDPEDSTIEVPSLSTIGRMLFGLIIGIVAVSTIRRLL